MRAPIAVGRRKSNGVPATERKSPVGIKVDLTNLLWLDAAQICRLYHHRWSIEIVFRWLKDRLQLDHFISRDPRGIIRQIVTALIVRGLLTIYNRGNDDFSPKKLWRELRRAMQQAIFDFGRRCQKHDVNPLD
jgi:hypothetical protein